MNTLVEEQVLTSADRCDACGAQAYVCVEMPFGTLMFCAHHAKKHREKIAEVAINIIDETDRISR